jgi:hypothetical protein
MDTPFLPDEDIDNDCQALMDHQDCDNGQPIAAWATPALQDLNPNAFASYSQSHVQAIMESNARRIDDDHLAGLKCGATRSTMKRTGIGQWQDRVAHRELVTVILVGLLVECVWLVWLCFLPISAMLLPPVVATCCFAYHTRPSSNEEQPPHLRDKGLMNVHKLQFLVHQMSVAGENSTLEQKEEHGVP